MAALPYMTPRRQCERVRWDVDVGAKSHHVRFPSVAERRMRTPIVCRHSAASAVLALFLVGSVDDAALAQTSPLWEHQASDSIAFFRVTPLGTVLVATSASLTSLEGTTGAPMWVRADKDLDETNVIPVPATPFA